MVRLPKFLLLSISVLLYLCLVTMVAINANKVIPDNPTPYVHYVAEQGTLARIVSSDSVYYLKIAQAGYAPNPTLAGFFPLFPLLVHIVTYLTNSYVLSGFMISWLAIIGALIILRKLLVLEGLKKLQNTTIILLLSFPTAFFLAMPYTESLFLLLTIGTIYLIKSQHYWLAALTGILATATRAHGIFLMVFVFFVLNQSFKGRRKNYQTLILLLIPLGLIGYMIYLQVTFGNFLQFYEAQKAWGHFGTDYLHRLVEWISPITMLVLAAFVFGVIQLYRRRYFDYAIYSACLLLPSLAAGDLLSISRYVLVIFPIFIGIGLYLNKPNRQKYIPWLAIFGTLIQGYYIALFANGYWVA